MKSPREESTVHGGGKTGMTINMKEQRSKKKKKKISMCRIMRIKRRKLITGIGGTRNEECEAKENKVKAKNGKSRKEERRDRKRDKRKQKRKHDREAKEQKDNNNTGKEEKQYIDELKTWGDEIRERANWPKHEESGSNYIRIMHLNANGITTKNEFVEWEMLLQSLHESQVDVFCINETNVDTRQSIVQFKVRDLAKQKDRHMYLNMSSSKQTPLKRESYSKPGGTMIGIRGQWAGRVIQTSKNEGKDDMGRWTVTHMKGKGEMTITIISVYQVCENGDGGKKTAFLQQQTDFLEKYGRLVDPRNQSCKDLERVALELIKKGNKLIICADINDDAGMEYKTRWNSMMDKLGMRNIHQDIHKGEQLPRTFDQGKRTLDIIAVSENISNDMIDKAGIIPFYTLSASDHRAMYIDVKEDCLFEDTKTDEIKHTMRRFTTKHVKKCDKYVETLTNLIEESKLREKVGKVCSEIQDLYEKMAVGGRTVGEETTEESQVLKEIEKQLQKLDIKRCQLMKAAENKCGKKKMQGMYWYSIDLRDAAKELSDAKKALRRAYTLEEYDEEKIEGLKRWRDSAITQLREVQKEDRKYRDEMMQDLAEKKSKPWKMNREQVMKVLKEAEKHSKIYRKINATVKRIDKGSIRTLMVPSEENSKCKVDENNDRTNGRWEEVRNNEDIFELILEKNVQMLTKSDRGMTVTGTFAKELGRDADNEELMNKVLAGQIDPEKFEFEGYAEEAYEMIRQMRRDERGTKMEWDFGIEEYKGVFEKTRESTSCGPSGLHMSHWKAALQSDEIMEIHAGLTWAAFQTGTVYNRWKISWHSMLQKLQHPYIHKMRIVQLFEGDMNGFLKYSLGRVLMRKLVSDGIVNDTTFGSVPGRNSLEAMKLLQLLYDNHRILKKDLVVVFNDAAGCYDRIRANQAEICARRVGCSTNVIKTHTRIQNTMVHYIKTAVGVSDGSISYQNNSCMERYCKRRNEKGHMEFHGDLGGVGQGGGGSPVMWLMLMVCMINVYNVFAKGAKIRDAATNETIDISLLSYVDDNSLLYSPTEDQNIDDAIKQMASNLLRWKRILRTTGGDLAIQKCTVTIMKWEWSDEYGNAKMMKNVDAPGTVEITDITEGEQVTCALRRLETNEGERQLGIILPIDGNFRQEFERRLEMSKTLGKRIYRAPLNQYESIIVYRMYYIPKVAYPICITHFSREQCNEIQSHFYRYALAKMGLNRHTPHALIFGPAARGGFDFHDLYSEQISKHIETVRNHVRRQDSVGRAFLMTLNTYEIMIGSSMHLFDIKPWIYSYGEDSSEIFFLWLVCARWKVKLTINKPFANQRRFQNEKLSLMDTAVNDEEFNKKRTMIEAINACRLYHRVTYPSDMSTYTGRHMVNEYLWGRRSMRTKQHEYWPTQPLPTAGQWTIWRKFIRKHYIGRNGEWLCPVNPAERMHATRKLAFDNHCTVEEVLGKKDLNTCIRMLPTNMAKFLECWNDENNCGEELWQAMVNGKLHIGIDGSHTPGTTNGAGAGILAAYQDEDNIIKVGCKCEVEQGMTSLTAEQCGLMSGLAAIRVLLLQYGMPKTSVSIKVWIDNAEVLKRENERHHHKLRLNEYAVSDYGVYTVICETLERFPTMVTFECMKVKSHQDDSKGGDQELPFDAKLNIAADQHANLIRTNMQGPQNIAPVYRTEGLMVLDDNGLKVKDIGTYVKDAIRGQDTIEYLKRKHGWTNKEIENIEWGGMETYLQKMPLHQRTNRLQLIHNWQNVGRQKRKFMESGQHRCRRRNLIQEQQDIIEEGIRQEATCPFQCGDEESHLHFMVCRSSKAKKVRQQLLKDTLQKLLNIGVHETIARLLLQALTWKEGEEVPSFISVGGILDTMIQTAIRQQSEIGWDRVKRGFISKAWTEAQEYYNNTCKGALKDWKSILVRWMIETSWKMWEERNKVIHGNTIEEARMNKIKVLQESILLLYRRARLSHRFMDERERRIFRMDVTKRVKGGVIALETWVKLATMVVEKVEERVEKRRPTQIEQWLNRMFSYQGWKSCDSDQTYTKNEKS